MSEEEWLASNEPRELLTFLQGNVSDRKLRLLAACCCRRVWHLLASEASRHAVEVAEQFADGMATEEQLELGRSQADLFSYHICNFPMTWRAEDYAAAAAGDTTDHTAFRAADSVCWLVQFAQDPHSETTTTGYVKTGAEHHIQANLIRDIAGNPFRSVVFAPIWRTRTVLSLTNAAYDSRHSSSGILDHSLLCILADALEEAGCDNPDILSHCRGPGPHVRGCWAVDLILGKK